VIGFGLIIHIVVGVFIGLLLGVGFSCYLINHALVILHLF
jgi:hypothetical protein